MGKKAKAEPRPALEPPAGTRWRTAIQPGSITMHLAAIGMARTLDRSRLGATTAFGPAEVDTVGDRPAGLHIWTVNDPDRIRRYRDWLLSEWEGRPDVAPRGLDRLLGLEPLEGEDQPAGPWVDALAAEGVAGCWQGPIGLGNHPPDRRPYLPILVNRGEGTWALALPYWPRSTWTAVSVAVRAADLYHGDGIGDRSLRSHSWAVYPVATAPTETLPVR
jgi:hypothetical protein